MNLTEVSGENFDHRIFKNKDLIEKRLPASFPNREKILELMREIEINRNIICYGKRKSEDKILKMIEDFQELKRVIEPKIREKDDKTK